MNACRHSEHPPVREKNVKTFRWDHRLQRQNLFMAFERVPLMVVTLGQRYRVGDKPTVIMYTYTKCHTLTPNKIKTKYTMSPDYSSIVALGLGSDGCR